MIKLCEDLGVGEEDVVLLVIAWLLKAQKMAEFSKVPSFKLQKPSFLMQNPSFLMQFLPHCVFRTLQSTFSYRMLDHLLLKKVVTYAGGMGFGLLSLINRIARRPEGAFWNTKSAMDLHWN